jgi:hypothetical protein
MVSVPSVVDYRQAQPWNIETTLESAIAVAEFHRDHPVVFVADKLGEALLVLTFRIWTSDP